MSKTRKRERKIIKEYCARSWPISSINGLLFSVMKTACHHLRPGCRRELRSGYFYPIQRGVFSGRADSEIGQNLS